MPKRCKGCHCAHSTERHRAQTTQSRQKPPPHPPSPPGPGPPIPLERYRKSGPGGPGAGTCVLPSPLPLCLVYDVLTEPGPLGPYQTHLLSHAGPGGRRTSPACGSCRRPLLSDENQGVAKSYQTRKSDEYRSMEGVATPRQAPHPHPPRPQTPHSARDISQKRARGAGAGDVTSPSPSPLLFN